MNRCLRQSTRVPDRVGRSWNGVHYAIAGGQIAIVRELLRRRLENANLLDLSGLAVEFGNLEMVRGFVGETSELFSPVCAKK
jgi:hypothetical protein